MFIDKENESSFYSVLQQSKRIDACTLYLLYGRQKLLLCIFQTDYPYLDIRVSISEEYIATIFTTCYQKFKQITYFIDYIGNQIHYLVSHLFISA